MLPSVAHSIICCCVGVVQDQPAWQYMHYIEKLTDGLPRVLLVHGCGNEVVTAIE